MVIRLLLAASTLAVGLTLSACSSGTTGATGTTTATGGPATTSAPKTTGGTELSVQTTWCALTLGEPKTQVLAEMGPTHGDLARGSIADVGGIQLDYAEWDVAPDIFLATFTNEQATNLQAYHDAVGPLGASDISCPAFRNSGGTLPGG